MSDRLDLDEEGLYALALGLPSETPSAELRERLLSSVGAQSRFEALVDRIAELIDLGADKVRELLAKIDSATDWVAGPGPTQLIHLAGGPRMVGVDVGFVRLAAGAAFPHHRHLGDEQVLVLQGGFTDSDGVTKVRGEAALKTAGSEHSFIANPGPDLVFLVLLREGVEIV